MKRLVWIVIASGAAHVASAQEDAREEDRGPYVGLSVGSFSYEQQPDPFAIQLEDTTSAFRIIGGYRFSDHFALEGSWLKTGALEDDFTRSISGGLFGINVKGDYDVRTIRALGILPLNDTVSLYGGLGYYEAKLDVTVTAQNWPGPSPGSYFAEFGDEGSAIVGGVEFKLERMNIRAEFEKLDTKDNSDAWDFNVGMLFRF